MSDRGTYIDGAVVHLDDAQGFPHHIRLDDLRRVARAANKADSGLTRHDLRWFERDVLNGAVQLLDQRDACTFTSPAGDCDQAAVFNLANARPRCDSHKDGKR